MLAREFIPGTIPVCTNFIMTVLPTKAPPSSSTLIWTGRNTLGSIAGAFAAPAGDGDPAKAGEDEVGASRPLAVLQWRPDGLPVVPSLPAGARNPFASAAVAGTTPVGGVAVGTPDEGDTGGTPATGGASATCFGSSIAATGAGRCGIGEGSAVAGAVAVAASSSGIATFTGSGDAARLVVIDVVSSTGGASMAVGSAWEDMSQQVFFFCCFVLF
jgi:hypothetical protein